MSTASSRVSTWLCAFLLLAALFGGAGFALATGLDPARSWTSGDQPQGAPALSTASGIDPSELIDARRAAGEANSQVGFLIAGTGELVAGTGQMRAGTTELPAQFGEAVTGAQELSAGLVQLQAGTGRLGDGAVEVADGVAQAVEQMLGFEAIRGQILQSLDSTLRQTEDNRDPQVAEARVRLQELRDQVALVQLDGEVAGQLGALRDGSREIANQLAVPGYSFHDGIYSATRGSQELAAGLAQAQEGIDDAIEGVAALDEGAGRIEMMANQTKDRIGAIQRALPATPANPAGSASSASSASSGGSVDPGASAGAVGSDGSAGATAGNDPGSSLAADGFEEQPRSQLSPLLAMLIGALTLLIGLAAVSYLGRISVSRVLLVPLGFAVFSSVVGVGLLALLATGFSLPAAVGSFLLLALTSLSSTYFGLLAIRLFGRVVGSVLSFLVAAAQVGLVAWVWKSAAASEVSGAWQFAANLFPLNWSTTGLSALINEGAAASLWSAFIVLSSLAVLGLIAAWLGRPATVVDSSEGAAT